MSTTWTMRGSGEDEYGCALCAPVALLCFHDFSYRPSDVLQQPSGQLRMTQRASLSAHMQQSIFGGRGKGGTIQDLARPRTARGDHSGGEETVTARALYAIATRGAKISLLEGKDRLPVDQSRRQ